MKNLLKVAAVIIAVLIVFLIAKPFFVVHEGEQALVVRFGRIVRTETSTGLKMKTPIVDKISRYPTKIQSWDGAAKEIPTSNKQFIWVDTTARWRISDPVKFYESVISINQAQGRLDEVIESSVKTVITRNTLSEAVRSSNTIFESGYFASKEEQAEQEKEGDEGVSVEENETIVVGTNLEEISMGRKDLSDQIYVLAEKQTEQFGIELSDVVIRQIRYSDVLTQSVYDRMIAERNQQAEYYRSKGEGEKLFWLGKLDREKSSILSSAYAEAEKIRGDADAQATRIYAETYSVDREFYNYWKAMDSYKKTLPQLDKTLTTDMDYFKYLYDADGR